MKKILFILLALFFISNVSAFAPLSHTEIDEDLFNQSSSKIIESCRPYESEFKLGSLTPDLAVIYYYSNGGKDYKLTHNWNFADEVMRNAVTQDEICFAYGIAAHLIADSVSHNQMVPTAIKKVYIPNWLLHPLLEQKYDSVRASKHPNLKNSSNHVMDALYGSKGDRYASMVQKALGTNTDIDAKNELVKLSISLGTFFQTQYKPTGGTLIFKIYPAIAKLTYILYPIIGNVNSGNLDLYYDRAVELEVSSFSNWGSRYQISPHGFDTLNEADNSANIFTWIYVLIAFGIPVGLALWRKSWWYLMFIPVLLILEVVIVYILI